MGLESIALAELAKSSSVMSIRHLCHIRILKRNSFDVFTFDLMAFGELRFGRLT